MNKTITIIIIAVLLAGGLGFYGGLQYGGSSATTSGGNQARFAQGGGTATGGQFGAARGTRTAGGGFTSGDILSKDANGMVISLRAGGSQIVLLSDSTQVQKMASGSLNDLTVGESVSVSGTTNSDGSLTANSIQLRPAAPNSTSGNGSSGQ